MMFEQLCKDNKKISTDEILNLVCIAYCCNKIKIQYALNLLEVDLEAFTSMYNYWLNLNSDMKEISDFADKLMFDKTIKEFDYDC